MKKRTKIIILSVMIVLLGVTGYLNIVLNDNISPTNTTTTTSYFVSYRNDRETSRDQQILYYDAIIDSETSTEDAVKNAEQAKLDLIALMEKELAVEGIIKSQGFTDCVVSITDTKVNVVVESAELTSAEVAKITTTVTEQLEVEPKNIVIIPVE